MRIVLLDFDGTCYRSDLPVQAYARRIAELLDESRATAVIAGMRSFLERKPKPDAMPDVFDTAEDGYELVRALAHQFGISDGQRRTAYFASREDLARSAFALDAEPGLVDWLTALRVADPDAQVWLATLAPPAGIREVLEAVGLAPLIDRVQPRTPKPEGIQRLAAEAVELTGRPDDLLGIGDRWAADLAGVQAVGGRTVHLDRYRRGLGTPTWRDTEFAPLVPALRDWAQTAEGVRRAS